MARKEFILQGFTRRTHANAIRELFNVADIQRVVLSVAFVTEAGVDLLSTQLKDCAARVTVFAGIRNDLTSRQGLGQLHALGVKLYTVDTGSRNVLFHPKLYLVRGNHRARIVVGSANLTLGGLNNNIEAGIAFDLDLTNKSDRAIIDTIEALFDELPKEYPDHVLKVRSTTLLDEMQASGRLVDEMAIPPPRPGAAASGGSSDPVPRIKLKVPPLHKALAAAKKATPKLARSAKSSTKAKVVPAPAVIGIEFELVWESKALTRRDLQIPTAANTHKTGSINLDQGLLPKEVDFQTYFYEDVFAALSWHPRSPTVVETYARCALVLKGISHGEFDVPISHTTSKVAAQKQRNALTRLRWGPMRDYIAREDLIGRTLALYRDKAEPKRFVLEID